MLTIQERFFSKVLKTETCWVWQANKLPTGYGLFRIGDSMQRAHRVAYRLTYGSFPEKLQVLHKCDNPSCVRPDHLWLGTNTDNVRDKVLKGRASSLAGEANPKAKLTAAQVIEMRKYWESGEYTQGALAKMFNIRLGTVSGVVNRTAWRNI